MRRSHSLYFVEGEVASFRFPRFEPLDTPQGVMGHNAVVERLIYTCPQFVEITYFGILRQRL